MPSTPPDELAILTAPDRLVELLAKVPTPTVVGFEPTPEHLEIHMAVLQQDDRAAAAGLFGLRAGPGWTAAGVVVEGRMREIDDDGSDLGRVRLSIVVHADGTHAHRVHHATGGPSAGWCPPDDNAGPPPEGLLIDALSRVLGRPSVAPMPLPEVTAMTMWSHGIVLEVLDGARPSWADLLSWHPGLPATSSATSPSFETIAEATRRAGEQIDWTRIHRRAVSGDGPLPPDLERHEAEWMDTPMYARWAVSGLAGPPTAVMVLQAHGAHDAAERFDEVCRRIRPDHQASTGGDRMTEE